MAENLTLRIEPGRAKDGSPEPLPPLEFHGGEVVAIVGPTGSGKTRLLADIERLSTGDSPTRRRVTLAGADPALVEAGWAVGRISQSMQFFLDLTVAEFVEMHAAARGAGAAPGDVIAAANRLAGEPFDADQPLASLSGGQARALMVADVVLVSDAPVLLIDEIENAGIDRHAALAFLVERSRLVFVATHDPLIALRASCRLVLGEGAIRERVVTTGEERRRVRAIAVADRRLAGLRETLRSGGTL
jgi:ABC-type lipoprotein export system ATPase subunit